jgi:hypothetical protein
LQNQLAIGEDGSGWPSNAVLRAFLLALLATF